MTHPTKVADAIAERLTSEFEPVHFPSARIWDAISRLADAEKVKSTTCSAEVARGLPADALEKGLARRLMRGTEDRGTG